MKRAQELRVDEFSAQKLRESHETVQRLTSQMLEMQKQMNSMNGSGDFQEVESNQLSYVPSQPAAIPSYCSMLSLDKRLPIDTWNTSGSQENVLGNQFSTVDSSQNHHQEIHHCTTPRERERISSTSGVGTWICSARDEERIKGTIPMPPFATRPSTMSSFLPVDIPQSSMVGQQRQQKSEPQFFKFPTPSTFLCWKIRFKNQVTACSGET